MHSDAAMARDLIDEIYRYATHRKGNLVDRVFGACAEFATNRKEKSPGFTPRRIRAFRNKEAAIVSYSEMIRLSQVAEAERKLARSIEEARKTHAEFIAETTRLASVCAFRDEEFNCGEAKGERRRVGGVAMPRAQRKRR